LGVKVTVDRRVGGPSLGVVSAARRLLLLGQLSLLCSRGVIHLGNNEPRQIAATRLRHDDVTSGQLVTSAGDLSSDYPQLKITSVLRTSLVDEAAAAQQRY